LAESGGLDVDKILGAEIYLLHLLLDIHWFTQCAWRWFPEGVQDYDRQIADLVAMLQAV
jgi:hypothetical protein